jgi:hypothetical protein
MAVVTVKSAQITKRDTVPTSFEDAYIAGANLRGASGVVAVTSGDSIGSKYIAFAIPAKAVPRSITITAPDIGTTTAADIGLYRTTRNGGAVVTAAFFTAAFVLNAGAVSKSDVTRGNVITVALSENRIKDCVGPLTFPTDTEFDVVLTLTGAADASGAVLVEASWTEG